MKGRLCLRAISKWTRCNNNYGYGHRLNPVYAVVKTLLDEGTSVDQCKTSFARCAVRLFQSSETTSTTAMIASYRCSVAPGLCWHRRIGRLKPATCVDGAHRTRTEELPDAASIAARQSPQANGFRAA